MSSWIGLDWVSENGPMSNSDRTVLGWVELTRIAVSAPGGVGFQLRLLRRKEKMKAEKGKARDTCITGSIHKTSPVGLGLRIRPNIAASALN